MVIIKWLVCDIAANVDYSVGDHAKLSLKLICNLLSLALMAQENLYLFKNTYCEIDNFKLKAVFLHN